MPRQGGRHSRKNILRREEFGMFERSTESQKIGVARESSGKWTKAIWCRTL